MKQVFLCIARGLSVLHTADLRHLLPPTGDSGEEPSVAAASSRALATPIDSAAFIPTDTCVYNVIVATAAARCQAHVWLVTCRMKQTAVSPGTATWNKPVCVWPHLKAKMLGPVPYTGTRGEVTVASCSLDLVVNHTGNHSIVSLYSKYFKVLNCTQWRPQEMFKVGTRGGGGQQRKCWGGTPNWATCNWSTLDNVTRGGVSHSLMID